MEVKEWLKKEGLINGSVLHTQKIGPPGPQGETIKEFSLLSDVIEKYHKTQLEAPGSTISSSKSRSTKKSKKVQQKASNDLRKGDLPYGC